MKIPASITIKTDKFIDDPVEGNKRSEVHESTVSGFIQTKKDGITIEYTEAEGEGDIITRVSLIGRDLVMLRRGNDSGMFFEQGKTHNCVFNNGLFPMELRVRTKELTNTISVAGGRLTLDYTIDIIGNRAEKSKLTLSVKPQSDLIS